MSHFPSAAQSCGGPASRVGRGRTTSRGAFSLLSAVAFVSVLGAVGVSPSCRYVRLLACKVHAIRHGGIQAATRLPLASIPHGVTAGERGWAISILLHRCSFSPLGMTDMSLITPTDQQWRVVSRNGREAYQASPSVTVLHYGDIKDTR